VDTSGCPTPLAAVSDALAGALFNLKPNCQIMYTSVKILSEGRAVFKCSQGKKVVRDETHFFAEKPTQAFKARCTACGCQSRAILESRRTARKHIHISGIYKLPTDTGEIKTGSMTIKDISWQGFKLRVSGPEPSIREHDLHRHRYDRENHGDMSLFVHDYLRVGELIAIEFFLDDPKMSFIARDVFIKWIKNNHMGVELRYPEAFEPSLRFYLLGIEAPL